MKEKEILEQLVKESNSFSEILGKQNKTISGASIKLLKQKLDTYKISYSFIKNKKVIAKTIPLEEILQKNRPYKAQDLKQRLIKIGILKDECCLCGQSNTWNGKALTLQLDHINGDHNDNRIENLRVLCPNCHSQTETFGNKRKYDQKYCLDCGKEIGNHSTYCRTCAPKHSAQKNYKVSKEDRPSKDELLELIKTKPFTVIGDMYNVTDNAVKKWCKLEGLPYTKQQIKEQFG